MTESTLVDLDELERQLAADVHAEDYECPRCECAFLGENEHESIFCQDCAYDVAENVAPVLIAELRAARAELAKAWDDGAYAGGMAEGRCEELPGNPYRKETT